MTGTRLLRVLLSRPGVEVRVTRTQSAEHAAGLAREAAQAGEEIVAFGGDGMVRIAAPATRGTGAGATFVGVASIGLESRPLQRRSANPRGPIATARGWLATKTRHPRTSSVNDRRWMR